MSTTKYLKCSCQQCGGRIEYPADAVGSMVECPHCRWQTELTVQVPGSEESFSRISTKWLAVGVVLLLLAGFGFAAPALLKRLASKRPARGTAPVVSRPEPAKDARAVQNGFEVGPLSVERSGSLTHVDGSLRDLLGKQRFSIRVQLECLDAAGKVITTTSDYAAVIEPNAEWRFRALVLKGTPASARLTSITEQQ
jgi:hypothetical protein